MMSGIVCNTGPLIALERVGLLHLFGPLFGHVLIPAAVEREGLGHRCGHRGTVRTADPTRRAVAVGSAVRTFPPVDCQWPQR